MSVKAKTGDSVEVVRSVRSWMYVEGRAKRISGCNAMDESEYFEKNGAKAQETGGMR